MSDEEKAVLDQLHKVVGKWALLLVGVIISISFAAGVWATNIENKISLLQVGQDQILKSQTDQIVATNGRVQEWTLWRAEVNEKLKTMSDMFTATDYDVGVHMFNRQGPKILMPYFYQIKREESN